MGDNQGDTTSIRDMAIQKVSQENVTKVTEIKNRISAEIEKIDDDLNEIEKLKEESIEKIELKKRELKELSGVKEFCEDKTETMKEMIVQGREIEARKVSITALDETIAILDKQIAEIQSQHDKASAKLDLKRRKLNRQLEYYDLLNQRLTDLLELLQKEVAKHEETLIELKKKRSDVMKEDLDDVVRLEKLTEIDDEIDAINKEHDYTIECIDKSLADMEAEEAEIMAQQAEAEADAAESLLTEKQLEELELFEGRLYRTLHPHMSNEERLALLRRGLQITPSGRIITKDDRIITLAEARLLGLLDEEIEVEEEEVELIEVPPIPEPTTPPYYAPSSISELTSSEKSSSLESELDQQDIEYLKRVFGKSLTFALAEIVAVQPSDPIHYLAHWFIKYRFNQEIDAVKRIELQALMIEREKIEAERWHRELQDEARLAVMEALFRAENIIMQHDYERMEMMMAQELEGEYDEESTINPMEFL